MRHPVSPGMLRGHPLPPPSQQQLGGTGSTGVQRLPAAGDLLDEVRQHLQTVPAGALLRLRGPSRWGPPLHALLKSFRQPNSGQFDSDLNYGFNLQSICGRLIFFSE